MAPRRILCVNGCRDTCEALRLELSREGYEVKTAYTLSEAIRHSLTEKFDLYIIEKVFTDGTGLALCEKLRSQDPSSVVIFYTADPNEPTKAEALKAGAHARLVDQGNIDALLQVIREVSP